MERTELRGSPRPPADTLVAETTMAEITVAKTAVAETAVAETAVAETAVEERPFRAASIQPKTAGFSPCPTNPL